MESLIQHVQHDIQAEAPEMLELFSVYANEARFGRVWLEEALSHIDKNEEILEIGGGMMLLACQLQKEGYRITALEPVGDGFSHFYRLQTLVLASAKKIEICPRILSCRGEELSEKNRFTFIYSINVMEHVNDINTVLTNAYNALKKGGTYRFICPNYSFPMESHFGIPTFGSKALTWKLMRKHIEQSKKLDDPLGLWASLNWITVRNVAKFCKQSLNTSPIFDSKILATYINRAIADPIFSKRHNKAICWTLKTASRFKLIFFTRLIPVQIMPIMDCSITRN